MSWALDLSQSVDLSHPLNRDRLAWWYTDGIGSGGQLRDLCGKYHGTLVNGPTWVPTGRGDSGLTTVSTSSQYATLGATLSAAISGVGTVAVSVRSRRVGNQVAISAGYPGSGQIPFQISLGSSPSAAYDGFSWFNAGVGWKKSGISSTTYQNDNLWHRFVGVQTADTTQLYIDGRLDSAAANIATLRGSGTGVATLGAYLNDNLYWTGNLSDASISRIPWSPADVALDYELSLRGYRTPDSPLRWIRGTAYSLPTVTQSVYVPAFAPGFGAW